MNEETLIFSTRYPLYLASSSPRRIAFLRELGLDFVCLAPPAFAEPVPEQGEDAEAYALRAARAKAESVVTQVADKPSIIVAADTVVELQGEILGKPQHAEEAFAMLRALAGHTHSVVSACALLLTDRPPVLFAVRSQVTMWNCPEFMLKAYANSAEPLDKAGAYAVQGAGAFLVERIEGSWSNVVGLPLAELLQELVRLDCLACVPENTKR